MTDFVSLTTALDGWFDKPLARLPEHLQERVREDFFPMPWDGLSSEQRQSVAHQWDYQHDPATEQGRQFWCDFFIKKGELEKQIEQWESVAAATAAELAHKEHRLKELRGELARMQRQEERARRDYLPTTAQFISAGPNTQGRYIAYPKAMQSLAERLRATPEELAAWIFMGPEQGGIAAYRNANELEPPPRFFFGHYMGYDYLAPMMACWFLEDDIEGFNPVDRYITGTALIERWNKQPGLQVEAFIRAKIAESRLLDLHPIYGATRGTISEDDTFPPLKTGLFLLGHVEAIEVEDGFMILPAAGDGDGDSSIAVADPPSGPTPGAVICAEFRAMTDLHSHEISIAFIGDKTEGLAGNNMLEIRARGVVHRVSLAELDLIDRRKGTLNHQAAVLIGLANHQALRRSQESVSATMSRLRAALRTHLGLVDDPFRPYRKETGWLPSFKLMDLRGLADQRAEIATERRMVSLDYIQERGAQLASSDSTRIDDEDSADRWLRENDPEHEG